MTTRATADLPARLLIRGRNHSSSGTSLRTRIGCVSAIPLGTTHAGIRGGILEHMRRSGGRFAVVGDKKKPRWAGVTPMVLVLLTALLATLQPPCAWAEHVVVYVDKDNTSGIEDGRSWATAFRTIQPAISTIEFGATGEVWVAEGLYDESRHSASLGSLVISGGRNLLGGFAGTETESTQRDATKHGTIIDGSKAWDGQPAHTVVQAGQGKEPSVIDGFTIRGGKAAGRLPAGNGGGLGADSPGVTVRHCIIEDNEAKYTGGGAYCSGGRIEFIDCVFRNNRSEYSVGGLAAGGNEVLIEGCLFTENVGESAGGLSVSGDATVRRCSFVRNRSTSDNPASGGGGARVYGGEYPRWHLQRLENCLFYANEAASKGGGLMLDAATVPVQESPVVAEVEVVNCTFAKNTAPQGPAIASEDCHQTYVNTVVWGHEGPPLDGIRGVVTLRNSLWQGGAPAVGRWDEVIAEGLLDEDPRFVNLEAGDLRLKPSSPALNAGVAEWDSPLYLSRGQRTAPADDFDGRTRPQGAGVDLGVYEMTPVDVNGNGQVDAGDVQAVVNGVLGLPIPPPWDPDVTGDGALDARDVQWMVNAVLGA